MPVRVNARAAARRTSPGGGAPLPFGLPYPPPDFPQRPAGISLCMIVKDEERFLPQCLKSVEGIVDEINIVDTGSTDRTVEIAQRFGARVEHRVWRDDFSWARNEALALATRRWILVLDADEELSPESRDLLIGMKNVPAHLTGLWVRCYNLADDYKGTGVSSHALSRIFPNHPRVRYRSPIHEFISLDLAITGLDCKPSPISIRHYGYLKGVVDDRAKGQRNLELIKAATESEPDEPFHWYNLGVTALIMNDRPLAVKALERMQELVGEKPRGFVPVGLSTLAEAYGEDNPEKAIQACYESLKRSPHFCNAHFALGRALSNLGRYEEAREAFHASIEDQKYNALQFVCDDEVSVWKAQSEIGHTYASERNAEKALEWFEKGLVNRPMAQPLRLNRARALEALRRYDDAEVAFREAYRDFRDDATIVDYVNFMLRRERYVETLEIIREALERASAPIKLKLLTTAATICERAGIDGVEGYLESALELVPGSALVLDELERRYAARNDTAKLERLHAIERDAPCIEPEDHARRSARLLAEGRADEALAWALQALETWPEHPRLLYAAGAAAVTAGRKADARAYLERIKPSDPDTFNRGTYLRALLSYEAGELQSALVALDTVLAAAPARVDALLYRAKVLEAMGRVEDVETTLRRALPLGGRQVAVELATFYMRIGAFEKARTAAEEALATA